MNGISSLFSSPKAGSARDHVRRFNAARSNETGSLSMPILPRALASSVGQIAGSERGT